MAQQKSTNSLCQRNFTLYQLQIAAS